MRHGGHVVGKSQVAAISTKTGKIRQLIMRSREAQSRVTRTKRDERSEESLKTKFTHLLLMLNCPAAEACYAYVSHMLM